MSLKIGEFSRFALSDEENVFVSTYANYVLNPFRARFSTDGKVASFRYQLTKLITDRTDSSKRFP
jgi:hypothetical protein